MLPRGSPAMVLLLIGVVHAKIYERCELARELKDVHEAPLHQLAVWVCLAEHESQYNTSAVGHLNGDGSGDHGLFQISDLFWCSPPGTGWACGVSCAQLEDDNIEDDFICAKRIYREHKQLSGDGFNAWAVYQPYCSGSQADKYIEGCFGASNETNTKTTFPTKGILKESHSSTTPHSSTLRSARSRLISDNSIRKDMAPRFIFNNKPWKL